MSRHVVFQPIADSARSRSGPENERSRRPCSSKNPKCQSITGWQVARSLPSGRDDKRRGTPTSRSNPSHLTNCALGNDRRHTIVTLHSAPPRAHTMSVPRERFECRTRVRGSRTHQRRSTRRPAILKTEEATGPHPPPPQYSRPPTHINVQPDVCKRGIGYVVYGGRTPRRSRCQLQRSHGGTAQSGYTARGEGGPVCSTRRYLIGRRK